MTMGKKLREQKTNLKYSMFAWGKIYLIEDTVVELQK